MSERDPTQTPTYIAKCPECDCLIACAVADVNYPESMRDAVRHQRTWTKAGYTMGICTVQDVRTWPEGKAFTHSDGCSRDKRKQRAVGRSTSRPSLLTEEA